MPLGSRPRRSSQAKAKRRRSPGLPISMSTARSQWEFSASRDRNLPRAPINCRRYCHDVTTALTIQSGRWRNYWIATHGSGFITDRRARIAGHIVVARISIPCVEPVIPVVPIIPVLETVVTMMVPKWSEKFYRAAVKRMDSRSSRCDLNWYQQYGRKT